MLGEVFNLSVVCFQWIEVISWGLGIWQVGLYEVPLYSSSNLVCLANERVWYGLESLVIGSYIYHSDVIAGMHAMLLI